MPALQDLGRRTRQLRNLVEPIAAAVFFVPEAHDAYVRLGFPPPQGTEDGIPLFDWGCRGSLSWCVSNSRTVFLPA